MAERWEKIRLHHAAALAQNCVIIDTGDLTPAQAAQATYDG